MKQNLCSAKILTNKASQPCYLTLLGKIEINTLSNLEQLKLFLLKATAMTYVTLCIVLNKLC